MGLIGNILSFTRRTKANGVKFSDIKLDVGGGDIKTAQVFEPAGNDSFPLITDKAIAIEIPRTGGVAVVGYLDPLDNKSAVAGESRMYSRDPGTALVVAQFHLKADGSISGSNAKASFVLQSGGGFLINLGIVQFHVKADSSISGSNANGSFVLQSGGDFLVDGVKIDTGGNIVTTGGDVTAGTISLKTHTHPAGTPPGPTGPPIP